MPGSPIPINCLNCNALFVPDCRNRGRQLLCSNPTCRAESKRRSQARWLSNPANAGYFKGSANVDRVRAWRLANPGYWKRSPRSKHPKPKGSSPQDPSQPSPPQPSTPIPTPPALQDPFNVALQDPSFPYHPLLVGLIALQTGATLQDDIRFQASLMAAKGLEIIRHGAGGFPPPS